MKTTIALTFLSLTLCCFSTAYAAELKGDFNGDGVVKGDDFLLWQLTPSVGLLADWETDYGMVAPLSATSAGIPEPTTCTLALAALWLATSRRRGR